MWSLKDMLAAQLSEHYNIACDKIMTITCYTWYPLQLPFF